MQCGILMRIQVWAFVALFQLAVEVLAADVYRWVDADGVTQYGSTPPPGVRATRVNVPSTPEPARKVVPQPPPPSSAALRDTGRLGAPGASAEALPGPSPETLAVRLQRCAEARQQLDVVTREGPVFRFDARGGRVYLSDESRDAELVRLRRTVAGNCAGLDSDAATLERKRQMIYFVRCRRATDKLQFLEQASTRSGRQELEEARQAVREYCASSKFPTDIGSHGEWFNAF